MEDFVRFADLNITAKPEPGETIGELAARCGVFIDQPCGGKGLCGKCAVLADGERVLACQTVARPGMTVTLPQQDGQMRILETEASAKKEVSAASSAPGIAVDIGTTTVVVYLVDTESGALLTSTSALNPQAAYGADVISRISYAMENEAGLATLHDVLLHRLNLMIADVLAQTKISAEKIRRIAIAGNTTMEHLFAGISPESIGRVPFEPQFYDALEADASEWGLPLCANAKIKLLPNISGFVGGDIVAGLLYCGLADDEKLSLFVDIGTNNEMALGGKEFLLCCSAAAGPALEGAKISQGTRAVSGAIDKAFMADGDLSVTTIGNATPCGICGSGLVDVVSVLYENGVISETGRFARRDDIKNEKLVKRLRGEKASEMAFLLTDPDENGGQTVSLTQKDVREFQLAKGAIATGIEIMLEEAGKTIDDVERVFVAGAFGNYLDFNSAVRVGLLPDVPLEKMIPLGNSAGLGACKLLCDESLWQEADAIRRSARHIELAAHPSFQEIFVGNLNLKRGK